MLALAGTVYATSLHRELSYDEGNYLASLDALRHGQKLGSDVFLDQPPGWYLLLQLLSFVFGNSVTGIRVGMIAIALVGLVAAWACGRFFGGPVAGLAAAALLAVAPPYPTLASAVESDPPSTVLALVSVALALYAYRGRPRLWLAVAAGVAFALAVSVKLFAVTAAPTLALVALRRRRSADVAWPIAGAVAVTIAFTLAERHDLHAVWQGIYGAHINARGGDQAGGTSNLHRILTVPDLHTPFGVLTIAALLAALVALLRRRPLGLWPLWLFAGASAVFTLLMKPLLDHHLVLLAASLAVPAGTAIAITLSRVSRPLSAGLAALVCVMLAGGFYQEHRRLARNDVPNSPDVTWAVREVDARTGPHDLVVSDIPAIPYLADRRMPGQLIDSSIARIVDHYLTPSDVLRLIDRSGVRLVVVGRLYLTQPQIVAGLEQRFPRRLRHGEITIYLPAR